MKLSPDDVLPGSSWSGSVVSCATRVPPVLELTLTPLPAQAVATKTARQVNEAARLVARTRPMPALRDSNAFDPGRWVTFSSHLPAWSLPGGTPIVWHL